MNPSGSDQSGDISKLESKVVLALSRLQKCRYPNRQGKSSGVASKQVANYLINHYCYLDGDIESQVMTALLSCVKSGLICALKNGKFRLLNSNLRNMASNCVTRTNHGPECTCLNLISSIRRNSHKTCCSYQTDGCKIKVKVGKSSDRERSKKLKSKTKKPSNRTTIKVKRQFTRRTRKAPTKSIKRKGKTVTVPKEVAPSAPAVESSEKKVKCQYCLEKHPPPKSLEKKVCTKCHPPGTRYGVPYDKFSPRDEHTSN